MITKLIPAFIGLLLGIAAGGFGGSSIANRAHESAQIPCPACNCPPAVTVDIGSLDFGKVNNKKGTLTIEQKFENVNVIVDSATYVKMLKSSK